MTQLKSLIKEVENLIDDCPNWKDCECENAIQLQAIRKTVEAVENMMVNKWWLNKTTNEMKDWQTLKKLLEIK